LLQAGKAQAVRMRLPTGKPVSQLVRKSLGIGVDKRAVVVVEEGHHLLRPVLPELSRQQEQQGAR